PPSPPGSPAARRWRRPRRAAEPRGDRPGRSPGPRGRRLDATGRRRQGALGGSDCGGREALRPALDERALHGPQGLLCAQAPRRQLERMGASKERSGQRWRGVQNRIGIIKSAPSCWSPSAARGDER
ncbi:unnamed protein product, partial [Prorocentrum cordatum]